MNLENVYKELKAAYENNDIKSFNALNTMYDLGLDSIEQVKLLENRPVIDLSMYYEDWDAQYMKNYLTSCLVIDMDKPVEKHALKTGGPRIMSYSYVIFEVLNALKSDSNFDYVLTQIDLPMDKDMAAEFLFSKGLIQQKYVDEDYLREFYNTFTVPELKQELKERSLKTSGRKNELIDRLVDGRDIDLEDKGEVVITDYGEFRLSGVNWVGFYKLCLPYFDFDDFETYMKLNDTGDVIQNSINYLDEHLKIAYDKKDFKRLHDVFSSNALININNRDFEEALFYELKIYILKLNPVFLDKDDLKDYKAIEYPNINNINVLSDLTEIYDLKDMFHKCWADMNLGEMLLTESEAFDYLNRAFDGEILDDLASEVADKYF